MQLFITAPPYTWRFSLNKCGLLSNPESWRNLFWNARGSDFFPSVSNLTPGWVCSVFSLAYECQHIWAKLAQGTNIFSCSEGERRLWEPWDRTDSESFVSMLLKSNSSFPAPCLPWCFPPLDAGYPCQSLSAVLRFSLYLHVSRDQLQQQEVSASAGQKQKPRLSWGSKTYTEQRLNGRLHCPQVDVAISIKWCYETGYMRTGDDDLVSTAASQQRLLHKSVLSGLSMRSLLCTLHPLSEFN